MASSRLKHIFEDYLIPDAHYSSSCYQTRIWGIIYQWQLMPNFHTNRRCIMKVSRAVSFHLQYHRANSKKNTSKTCEFILTKFTNRFGKRDLASISQEEVLDFLLSLTKYNKQATKRNRYSGLSSWIRGDDSIEILFRPGQPESKITDIKINWVSNLFIFFLLVLSITGQDRF